MGQQSTPRMILTPFFCLFSPFQTFFGITYLTPFLSLSSFRTFSELPISHRFLSFSSFRTFWNYLSHTDFCPFRLFGLFGITYLTPFLSLSLFRTFSELTNPRRFLSLFAFSDFFGINNLTPIFPSVASVKSVLLPFPAPTPAQYFSSERLMRSARLRRARPLKSVSSPKSKLMPGFLARARSSSPIPFCNWL